MKIFPEIDSLDLIGFLQFNSCQVKWTIEVIHHCTCSQGYAVASNRQIVIIFVYDVFIHHYCNVLNT